MTTKQQESPFGTQYGQPILAAINEEDAKSSDFNTTQERSIQLKQTNDRLAKLERMYEELTQLEARAKSKP